MITNDKPMVKTAVFISLFAAFVIYTISLTIQTDISYAYPPPTSMNFLPLLLNNYETPLPTNIPTAIPTNPPTATPTPTNTPTATPSPTNTPTATSTPTSTPTATSTSSSANVSTLLSPAVNAQGAKFSFDWSDVAGASSYTFQLSTTDTFDSIAFSTSVSDSEYTYNSTLSGNHYWRVAALGEPYSDARTVTLINYADDDDGDSLPNGWELHGYDANSDGNIDVDLPALGANYDHKDIFIEMDYMVRASAAFDLGPNQTVLDAIEAVFANAPVSNPDGVDGIAIHLELDDEVPYNADLNPYWTEFYALKALYFDVFNKSAVYHYMIWANGYNGGSSSGVSFGLPASDFIVSLGLWNGSNGGTDSQKVGTFIHELGHNLGLKHGGSNHSNYKPNYLSVMNYFFQTWGVYRDGSWGGPGNWLNFDYQRFDLPTLDETNLDETVGLNGGAELNGYGVRFYCNGSNKYALPGDGAIDWNCDGDTTDTGVAMDINDDGSNGTLAAQDNWASIRFDGNGVIGSGLPGNMIANQIVQSFTDPQLEELTYEMMLEMEATIKR